MSGRIVKCEYCGKTLFAIDSERELFEKSSQLGYIFKLPVLFNGSASPVVFCTEDCCKSWFDENLTDEQRKRGRARSQSLKDKMPGMVRNAQKVIADFSSKMKYIKEELNKGRSFENILNDSGMEVMKQCFERQMKNKTKE